MTSSHKLFVLGLASLILTSCGGGKEHENNAEAADSIAVAAPDTAAADVNDTTKFKFDFAIANIPSPASTLQDMSTWGVPYDNSILNNPGNASKYSSEFQKSTNLGIYNIDMAYAMVNEKGPDVLTYMKSILTMGDALGLRGAVSNMVGKRAEANLSTKDSLFKILDEIFVKSDSYLRSNDRVYTAGCIFAGSWVESLYLNSKVGEAATDGKAKEKAHKLLWEQRFHLGNLINLLADYKDKKDGSELMKELKPIHEEIMAVRQHADIDDAKFTSISSKIIALRDRLVK